MTPNSLTFDESIELGQLAAARPNVGDRFILLLTTAGIVAAVVAYISYDLAARAQLRPDELYSADVVKTPLYYATYAAQIILLASAGLLALLTTNLRNIERGFVVKFALFIGAAFLMAARGFSTSEVLSTKLVDGSGPFPLILSVLIFVGAKRANWVVLEKIMFGLAIFFCGVALFRMTGLQTFTRQEGVANLGNILNALYWPAAWVALRAYPRDSFGNRVKLIPLFVYGLGSLFTQTRLNVLMVFALFAVYAIVQRKRRAPQAGLWIGLSMLVIWTTLFTATFLRGSRVLDRVQDVTNAFAERLDEDTRTEQLTAFFSTVAPSELVLGRGSMATWDWDGYDWRGGTDVGYLTLLLFGGLPLLVTYFLIHLKPCISTIFKKSWEIADWRLVGAGVGVLWAFRMFSSSYASTAIDYYCILFCVGAAISREQRTY
jgi:hypothetical protein